MEEELREIGLTKNESKVYLAMLRLKNALAGQIAEKSGVHRRNVYDALERLTEKGLVSYVYGRKRKYFKAEPPQNLMRLIEIKREILSEGMPKLNSMFQEYTPEVNVRVYSGKESLKNILEDQLKTRTEILVYGKSVGNAPELRFYFPQYKMKRVKKKINIRAILNESSRKTEKKFPFAKIKYLPDDFIGPISTSIYDGKIAIMLMLETTTIIIIENKKLYESYKKYFKLIWNIAK
jgi:sugar-specific transcriptional regulator TrmB